MHIGKNKKGLKLGRTSAPRKLKAQNKNKIKTRNKKVFTSDKSKKLTALLPALTMTALAALLAIPGALLWQKLDTPMEQQQFPAYMIAEASSQEASSQEESVPESQPEEPDVSEAESPASQPQEDAPAAADKTTVPKGEWVESSYFDDAVFIGDSLTVGIRDYQIMPNATVIAKEGLNPQTIQKNTAVKNKAGKEVKVIDALKEISPRKIYIMLGSNGFHWLSKDVFIKNYTAFIEDVKSVHPDALVYVQSMPPVTAKKAEDERFSNDKIREYNAAILEMCKQEQVYFMDINAALSDSDGCLPAEASPKDGMHFGPKYYRKWMDYLMQHTAQ